MSSPIAEELIKVQKPEEKWLKKINKLGSPSENITFDCPYTLRKTSQLQFYSRLWTVGDIALVGEPKKKAFVQIIELYQNAFTEKRAKVIWLAPKVEHKVINYSCFQPNDYTHISVDKRLVPIECLKFIMRVPKNNFEYKKYIGIDYLIDTSIISHAERYPINSVQQKAAKPTPKSTSKPAAKLGPKPKSKVQRRNTKQANKVIKKK